MNQHLCMVIGCTAAHKEPVAQAQVFREQHLRADAKARGLKAYRSQGLCVNGHHPVERRVSDRQCLACAQRALEGRAEERRRIAHLAGAPARAKRARAARAKAKALEAARAAKAAKRATLRATKQAEQQAAKAKATREAKKAAKASAAAAPLPAPTDPGACPWG